MAKFKKEVLDIMKSDIDLFAAISKELGIKPPSLPMAIERNSNRLNQYSIVTLVANHLGKHPDDLLEEDIKDNTIAA